MTLLTFIALFIGTNVQAKECPFLVPVLQAEVFTDYAVMSEPAALLSFTDARSKAFDPGQAPGALEQVLNVPFPAGTYRRLVQTCSRAIPPTSAV